MVGKAGATMVCSSAERNIASMMPIMMARIEACGSGCGAASAGAVILCADGGGAHPAGAVFWGAEGDAVIGPHHAAAGGKFNRPGCGAPRQNGPARRKKS